MGKILVTGGAGYIGSHTVMQLSGAGYRPVVFDNFSTGHRRLLTVDDVIEGDLSNPEDIARALRSAKFDGVIHFASHCYVGESYENPYKYYHDNILNALNLLRAMVDQGVSKLIFSSTCAVYGTPETVPIPEQHPTVPINPYGHSKRCIEWMLEDFGPPHGIEFVSLRYFNAAGADAGGRLGEMHDPETHLIPRIFMAATGKLPDLVVYGRDYPTPDGTCVRDYIHVTDLARAHLLALERLLSGKGSALVNLGTGQGFSVDQILAAAARVIGHRVPVVYGERRLGDPAELVADNRAAVYELGWRPEHSSLESILQTAWRWFQRL